MVEKIYKISTGDDKIVEKVIMDDNLHYIHMIFKQNEGLPKHL